MNHQPLIINGSDDFKKAVLKTAVLLDLHISFDDLTMQNDFLRYKEIDYPDRKKFAFDTVKKILQHLEKTNAQSHLEYINRETCQDYEEPRLERLKLFRELRERHFDLVMKLDASTKETDELEIKDDVHFVSSRIKALIESKEYSEQKFLDPLLANLKNKMLTAVAEVNKWKRSIISQHDAELQAKLEYMTKSEQELWIKFFETLAQKKHLELFLKTLKKPDESDKEATRAFEQIASGVKNQIADLDSSLSSMKKPVEDIRRRLDLPDCRNNILMVTHQILQANTHARQMLKRANINLDKVVDDLRNALFAQSLEEPQTNFKTREVYDLIRHQYRALKKEHKDLYHRNRNAPAGRI